MGYVFRGSRKEDSDTQKDMLAVKSISRHNIKKYQLGKRYEISNDFQQRVELSWETQGKNRPTNQILSLLLDYLNVKYLKRIHC